MSSVSHDERRIQDATVPTSTPAQEKTQLPPTPEGKKSRGRAATNPASTLKRAIKLVFTYYPRLLPLMILVIILAALLTSLPSVFMQQAIEVVGRWWQSGNWKAAAEELTPIMLGLLATFGVSIVCYLIQSQLGAYITQGTLMQVRNSMFDHMEELPISYFDQNAHGDIMSHYTNDVDTLRQLISQALPNLLTMFLQMIFTLFVMLYYSINLSVLVLVVVVFMTWLIKYMGGKSARFFLAQQVSLAREEGVVEEAMNGQKVIKVFTHEKASQELFDQVNEELFQAAKTANIYGNTLGPILMNLGNLSYVLVALSGGLMLATGLPNASLSGLVFGIDIIVPFLNLTKRFAGSIGQTSQQINFVVMGLAGAERIFNLLDQQAEQDSGYVTLTNMKQEGDKLVETHDRTDTWAWKHPHATQEITYTPLKGDVRLEHVNFGYTPDHEVLHDISLYAKPGQKVAFVGATGAGKTTITNLINRFYDISDGKIRYDGINIEKIKKSDLRRSLGIVLQEVNLFTGSIMDNIRYGRLSATDEECIQAAKLAGADSFIERLPEGYDTWLTDNAAQLSQGQRQLISIARAAVADPPVMILDEATSSIDTRTEQIVQRGMDALMKGRTTFVIAHRLSTVRNANVIIVLDHGKIIERGTHDELIAQKGTYYQLYTGAFELE
ncbi:MAG: ABC transporter ATP-binding protein [Atopobiaceae bacterium]|jgi:ATP-binding cassette subfamily B multidrug efflux pump